MIIPIILNSLQFIVQDMFLKKSDFEITDMDILKKFYCTHDNEDLDISLTRSREGTLELDTGTAVPSSSKPKLEKPLADEEKQEE